ncbi:tetratricopeptide repeat protein [Microbacterium jejuense]|uniref:Tetratricopeptide repeat protein n=1 Tax=Microbacterium jejuense TaxID=1263637 RepID=A0ABS7HH08_9MICO|nr:tetratricopeptide repeat protein [Microbacterium jejuense]MBW9092207.1 tetratricopeptide repeat protein [Microbacterium jejuense]
MTSWDDRVAEFWDTADDADPAVVDRMRELVAERPADDPAALFEWASVLDFVGREDEAVAQYRAALAAGLDGDRMPQAVVQLASSLRNIGRADEGIELLWALGDETVAGAAVHAFLALCLRDAGRPDEAFAVALRALAPTLPMYGRSIAAYADELDGRASGPGPGPGPA